MPSRSSAPARDQAPATAVVVFDPVVAGKELAVAVEGRRPQLAALMGVELESERGKALLDRFVTVSLHAATSNPDLLRATKESLVESIRDAAMLGLEPVGVTGDGAIVVYNEKRKEERPGRNGGMIVVEVSVPVAHFQPMYRGLLKLARRSEKIEHIDAHVVYEGDVIELDLGSSPSVRHLPVLDGSQRGNYLGAYAVAETKTGRRYVDWMTLAEIEIVRKHAKAKDAMAWSDFWPEMARKTVLRRLMKRLPLETLADHALRIENEAESRSIAVAELAPVDQSDARKRLRGRFSSIAELETGSETPPDGSPPEKRPETNGSEANAGSDGKAGDAPTGGQTGDQAGDGDPGPAPGSTAEPVEGTAREVCGDVAPEGGISAGEVCGLEPDHGGNVHKNAGGTASWPK